MIAGRGAKPLRIPMGPMLLHYGAVAFASTLKFIGGPITGAALGLTWVETALCSAAGMMFTVLLVSLGGEALQRALARPGRRRPLFSRRTRLAVRVYQRTGVVGISLLTPLVFTPPLGAALAVSFKPSRRHLYASMLASGLGWGTALSFLVAQVPGWFGG